MLCKNGEIVHVRKGTRPEPQAAENAFGVGGKEPARPNDKDDEMTKNKRSSAISARSLSVTCCYSRILPSLVVKLG